VAGLGCARKHFESPSEGISYPNVSPVANWRTGVPKPSAPVNGTLIVMFRCVIFHHMIESLTVFLWSTPNTFTWYVPKKRKKLTHPHHEPRVVRPICSKNEKSRFKKVKWYTDTSVLRKLKATAIVSFSFSDATVINKSTYQKNMTTIEIATPESKAAESTSRNTRYSSELE